MSITKSMLSGLACSLVLAVSARPDCQSTPLCEAVPTFPQYEEQSAGDVDGIYNTFCTHPVMIAQKKDGELVRYDKNKHAGWLVVGNHDKYPAQRPLAPNEAIGVVVVPVKIDLWKYVICAALALLLGLAAGYAAARRQNAT